MTNIDSIARQLASDKNITIKLATELVKATFEITANELSTKNEVYIKDFGTFSVKARKCRKPGEAGVANPTFTANVIHFKPFKFLKQLVK